MSLGDRTLSGLLEDLASRAPVPGGGAVAAITSALAASLAQMVVRFSMGKALAGHEPAHRSALETLERLVRDSLDAADEDARAYADLSALWKLPQDDPARRDGWSSAVAAAIAAPQRVIDLGLDVLRETLALCGTTNRRLASDLAMAAILAEAAVRSAEWNVRINLPLVTDETQRAEMATAARDQVTDARSLAEEIESTIR